VTRSPDAAIAPRAVFGVSAIGAEALDDPATDPQLVRRIVADLARSNRWLGGAAAVRWGLAHLIDARDTGATLTLLDIGTGAGDLPLMARRWAAQRGVVLRPLGLERIGAAAHVARDAGIPMIIGCAGALPIARGSVDIVLLSQVLHHLDRASAVALLQDMAAIARRGVIVADLRPTWYATRGFRVAGRALGLHRTTIRDGVTSLRRGFAPRSLAALFGDASLAGAHVQSRPMARVGACWRQPEGEGRREKGEGRREKGEGREQGEGSRWAP
jgi:SAM-dependent methyltransferase